MAQRRQRGKRDGVVALHTPQHDRVEHECADAPKQANEEERTNGNVGRRLRAKGRPWGHRCHVMMRAGRRALTWRGDGRRRFTTGGWYTGSGQCLRTGDDNKAVSSAHGMPIITGHLPHNRVRAGYQDFWNCRHERATGVLRDSERRQGNSARWTKQFQTTERQCGCFGEQQAQFPRYNVDPLPRGRCRTLERSMRTCGCWRTEGDERKKQHGPTSVNSLRTGRGAPCVRHRHPRAVHQRGGFRVTGGWR